jgi:hypothetical protein
MQVHSWSVAAVDTVMRFDVAEKEDDVRIDCGEVIVVWTQRRTGPFLGLSENRLTLLKMTIQYDDLG